jgi:hypothetical protein
MKKLGRAVSAVVVLIVLIIAVAGVNYTLSSLRASCDVQAVAAASGLLRNQLDRFDHSYQFATSASQDSLVHPVNTLQQILMDTQQIPVPACLLTAREELVGYMAGVVRAFQAYGAQEPEPTIRELIERSDAHYGQFFSELEAVNVCAPLCIR